MGGLQQSHGPLNGRPTLAAGRVAGAGGADVGVKRAAIRVGHGFWIKAEVDAIFLADARLQSGGCRQNDAQIIAATQ